MGRHWGPAFGKNHRYPDGRVRYFTVRESARIQTFPDEYVFTSSWTESMRQLGNAVPVKLAEAVAASIAAKIRPLANSQNAQTCAVRRELVEASQSSLPSALLTSKGGLWRN